MSTGSSFARVAVQVTAAVAFGAIYVFVVFGFRELLGWHDENYYLGIGAGAFWGFFYGRRDHA